MVFSSEHVETKEITVKLLKIIADINVLSGTQLTVKQQDLASPCYIYQPRPCSMASNMTEAV